MDFTDLSSDERLILMRFLCAFAWADGEVQGQERAVIMSLLEHMQFSTDQRREVIGLLDQAPVDEEIDLTSVSEKHRIMFRDLAYAVVSADGRVHPGEKRLLALVNKFVQ